MHMDMYGRPGYAIMQARGEGGVKNVEQGRWGGEFVVVMQKGLLV